MNDKKYTITRSFARKITDGNYGSIDYYSSHSEEVDADCDQEVIMDTSHALYQRAYNDVQEALGLVYEKTVDTQKVVGLIKRLNQREGISVDEWESLTSEENQILKQADLAFKRSDEFKGAQKVRKECRSCGGKLTVAENNTGDTCTECRNSPGGMKKY